MPLRYAECHYAECHYAECHYAECRYAECHYAECRGAFENKKKTIFRSFLQHNQISSRPVI